MPSDMNDAADALWWALAAAEPLDPVLARQARDRALGLEQIQMREHLADREAELMDVQLAAEQNRDQLHARARLGKRVDRFAQTRVVMARQRVESRVQAAKRQAV